LVFIYQFRWQFINIAKYIQYYLSSFGLKNVVQLNAEINDTSMQRKSDESLDSNSDLDSIPSKIERFFQYNILIELI